MLRISLQSSAQHDLVNGRLVIREPRRTGSVTAGAGRWCGTPIWRWLFTSVGRCIAGRFCGSAVGFSAGLRRFLTRARNSFLRLCCDGLSRFFGFLADSLSSFFGFRSDGLGRLLGFLPNGFGRFLCFLTCGFHPILNCLPCLLRALLYFLTYAFLSKNGQRSGCNQRDNQARDSHVFLLSLAYLRFESGTAVARTNGNLHGLKTDCDGLPGLAVRYPGNATRALVNSGKRGRRDSEKIEHRN